MMHMIPSDYYYLLLVRSSERKFPHYKTNARTLNMKINYPSNPVHITFIDGSIVYANKKKKIHMQIFYLSFLFFSFIPSFLRSFLYVPSRIVCLLLLLVENIFIFLFDFNASFYSFRCEPIYCITESERA